MGYYYIEAPMEASMRRDSVLIVGLVCFSLEMAALNVLQSVVFAVWNLVNVVKGGHAPETTMGPVSGLFLVKAVIFLAIILASCIIGTRTKRTGWLRVWWGLNLAAVIWFGLVCLRAKGIV